MKDFDDKSKINEIIDNLMEKFKDDDNNSIDETLQNIEDEFGVKKNTLKEYIEKSIAIKKIQNNNKGGLGE